MKCEHCGKEIVGSKEYETKSFNGLEVTRVLQKGNSFNDLVIPKGFELLTLQEGVDLLNNEEFVKYIDFRSEKNDFFVKQPFKNNEGRCAAWLGCDYNIFFLNGYYYLNNNLAARGVVLKKTNSNKRKFVKGR